jgi:hypothetical protein
MDSLVDHILLLIIAIIFLNGKQEGLFFPLTLFFAQFCDIVNLVIFFQKISMISRIYTRKKRISPKNCQKNNMFFSKNKNIDCKSFMSLKHIFKLHT